ncbi:hypothetical protein Dimus_039287 [Dionaea muscipula]
MSTRPNEVVVTIGSIPVTVPTSAEVSGTAQNGNGTLSAPMMGLTSSVAIPHGEKLEKFSGSNFRRWQQKMHFYLTTLSLARFVSEEKSVLLEGETDRVQILTVEAWVHSDFLCRNYILNGLSDTLYNVYSVTSTAKELWDSLDRKYKTEDAGTKKFVVGKFLDFKMVNSKTVMSQVQELQLMYHKLAAEGMTLIKAFLVAAMIEKLPPGWKEFKSYLMHKTKPMTLESLIVKLRILEDNKAAEKQRVNGHTMAKANMVEDGSSGARKGLKKKYKTKGSTSKLGPKKEIGKMPAKKPKFQDKCFNCGKNGYRMVDCRLPKQNKNAQANMMEDPSKDVSTISLAAVVSEVNLIGSNTKEWWVDTDATRHVCSEKSMFTNFKPVANGEKIYMDNSASSPIEGEGKVILKMTSGKELTLNNMLYVPEIRKNLISGSLLSKHGFRLVFEADKIILSIAGMYVGKGHMSNGMFKLNIMNVFPKVSSNEKATSSAYLTESSNLWHGTLGHVNYDSIRKLINLDHIPKFHLDTRHKCEVYVEAKLAKPSFHKVKRDTKPLDLIHSDVCDLKFVQTRDGKKYFITFIDDSTKYSYVYLLKRKDEAVEKFVLFKNEVENQLSIKIKVSRSDRGGEYEAPFSSICAEHGIIHQTTAPYTPQQNGVAERKNRTLKDMMNALLISFGLPQNMWGEAILTDNYILNKVPRKRIDKTPYELWHGRKPSYDYLRMWGCLAKVAVPTPKRVRIGPKTVDCVFIGYAQNSSAYRFLVHESDNPDVHKNTIMESRNVVFFEHLFPYKSSEESCSKKRTLERLEESVPDLTDYQDQNQGEESILVPRRSKRARIEKSFGPDFHMFMMEAESRTYQEAVSSLEGPFWKVAIKSEVDSIL